MAELVVDAPALRHELQRGRQDSRKSRPSKLQFRLLLCLIAGMLLAYGSVVPRSANSTGLDLWHKADSLSRLLLEGGDPPPLAACIDVAALVLNEARPLDAFPGRNGGWVIPVAEAKNWISLQVLPEADAKHACEIVLTLTSPTTDSSLAPSKRLVSLNFLVDSVGIEVMNAHVQHLTHRTRLLEAQLRDHGPLLIGGGFRVSRQSSDWIPLTLSLTLAHGSTSWTSRMGEVQPRNGALSAAVDLQLLESRLLALIH